jgi:hypothetical protein
VTKLFWLGRIWDYAMCSSNGTDAVPTSLEAAIGHVHVAGDDFFIYVGGLLLGSGHDWTRR